MDNVIEIIGAEKCLEITPLAGTKTYTKGAKVGKSFSSFKYRGIVFTVDSEDAFCTALPLGQVQKVVLIKSKRTIEVTAEDGTVSNVEKDTLSFDCAVTTNALVAALTGDAQITALRNKLQSGVLTDAAIEEMETLAG